MNREELLKNAKPILFNTEMVQAILEGRKTVTRRIIKPQPNNIEMLNGVFSNGLLKIFYDFDEEINIKAPYEVGDILYVRETWYYENHMHDLIAGEPDLPNGEYSHRYVYRASSPDYPVNVGVGKHGWMPSIHMPKIAARIFLKVTYIRVERLQGITEGQAYKEGTTLPSPRANYVNSFISLWDGTIKKQDLDKYGWEANPWVWIIEFEKKEREEK
ncbi:MAG: hypothetical protein WC996_06805 [Peptostreptococcales bacterium]